jgi:tetratricopeptide (TPR) repeat protein
MKQLAKSAGLFVLFPISVLILAAVSAGAISSQSPSAPPARPGGQAQSNQVADPLAPLLAQAQNALDRMDYAGAVPLLVQIAKEKPADALPHFELGYAYSELNKNAEAVAEYHRALELDPKLAPAHLNLGLVQLDSDPDSAAASFRRASELLPDQARPRYLEGEALERSGKLPEALAAYRTAASLAPKDDQVLYALGRVLLAAGQAAEAESAFRQELVLRPDAAPAQLGVAEAMLRQNKTAEAVDLLAAYLKGTPGDRQAHFERSVALQDLSRLDEALAELDLADQGASPTTESMKLRGSIYLQQRKFLEADTSLQQALLAAPDDPELHTWLGHVKMELREYALAESELRRAFALAPAQIDPLRDLAGVLYLSGQYAAAITALDQIAQRETPTALNWFFRAISCDKLGRKPEAVAAYQKFLESDQGSHPDQEFQATQRVKLLLRELNGTKKK